MDVYVLLDVLLIILVALFIPIGFWRGAYRESFVSLGILFGASMGRFWGERWGAELANISRLHESGGAFMIAMLCLVSATFLLGYSAGAALPVPDPGWISRTLGALIAGANGALLLSFALQDIRQYLLTSEEVGFLDNAFVAPFLSDGTGWILLVAAAVFAPIALVLAVFGPDIEEDEYYETGEFDVYDSAESYEPFPQRTLQQQSPAFPQRQSRPVPAHASTQRPIPAPAEETRPAPAMQMQPSSEDGAATQRRVPQPEPSERPHSAPRPQTSPAAAPSRESEQPRHGSLPTPQPAASEPGPQPQRPHFGTHSVDKSTDEREVVFGHRPQQETPPPAPPQRSPRDICLNCKADIRDADGYCPRCGERI